MDDTLPIQGLSFRFRPSAAQSVELVLIVVAKGNESAFRLYRSAGFVEYGAEPHARKIDGRYYDDILMATDLVARG